MEGRVKWFNEKKGHGFVETENDGDIFVHYSGIEDTGGFRSLQEGEKVDFEIEQTQRGPQAVQVKKQDS
jgi:CspA family cold shock protein